MIRKCLGTWWGKEHCPYLLRDYLITLCIQFSLFIREYVDFVRHPVQSMKSIKTLSLNTQTISWGWWLSRHSDETINRGPVCVCIQNFFFIQIKVQWGLHPCTLSFRTSSTHYKDPAVSVLKSQDCGTIQKPACTVYPVWALPVILRIEFGRVKGGGRRKLKL
jgi:hypothetical protein